MSEFIPRDYQHDCDEAIEEQFRHHQSTVAVMPTGSGKTIVFARVAERHVPRGRVMILAHREELIEQAADKVHRVTGLPVDVEMADRRASQLWKSPIVVSSIQTQTAGRNGNRRMHQFNPAEFALVIADECHHAAADTWRETLGHYASNPACKVLGVTATPKRTDQRGLCAVFDSVAFRMGLADGIREGWLVPIVQRYRKIEGLDYGTVKVSAGDFQVGSLSEFMRTSKMIEAVCADVTEFCSDRTSLVFCVDVEHAEQVTKVVNEFRPGSAHLVTGKTPSNERRALIRDYREGQYPCLVNCMVATEGFDVPRIVNVVMARPTQSPLLYEQMLGRGTRPLADVDGATDATDRRGRIAASAKPNMTVVDYVGNSTKHEIVTVIDVLGGTVNDQVRELAERMLDQDGGGDVLDAMRSADAELQAREKTRHAKAIVTDRIISPFGKGDPFAAFGIDNEGGKEPIEDWQREKLDYWRMPIPKTAEEAQDLIDEVKRRTRRGLATYRMVKVLERNHVPDARNISFDRASTIIDELRAKQGW